MFTCRWCLCTSGQLGLTYTLIYTLSHTLSLGLTYTLIYTLSHLLGLTYTLIYTLSHAVIVYCLLYDGQLGRGLRSESELGLGVPLVSMMASLAELQLSLSMEGRQPTTFFCSSDMWGRV